MPITKDILSHLAVTKNDPAVFKSPTSLEPGTILRNAFRKVQQHYSERNLLYRKLIDYYTQDRTLFQEEESVRTYINRVFNYVNTYADYLTIMPEIQMIPPEVSPMGLHYSDTLEKLCYLISDRNFMTQKIQPLSIYALLLGEVPVRALPNPNSPHMVDIYVIDPRKHYPVFRDNGEYRYLFYEEMLPFQDIIDKYPSLNKDELLQHARQIAPSYGYTEKPITASSYLSVLEYWDDNFIVFVVGNQAIDYIKHDWGFVSWELIKNRWSPNRRKSSSMVENIVDLQDVENQQVQWDIQLLDNYTDPILVVTGSKLEPGDIDPGSRVIAIEIGGKVEYLTWAGPPALIDAFHKRIDSFYAESTGVSAIQGGKVENIGGLKGSSRAISAMQGPFQASLSAKQLTIGSGLSRLFEKILQLIRKEFPNKPISLVGLRNNKLIDVSLRGKDIEEYNKVEFRWPFGPINDQAKLLGELQKQGQGIQAKRTTMERLGVRNPDVELDLIRQEQMEELRYQAMLAQITGRGQQGTPLPTEGLSSNPEVNQSRAEQFPTELPLNREEGTHGLPVGQEVPPSRGTAPLGSPPTTTPGPEVAGLEAIAATLRSVQKLKGEVFLAGVDEEGIHIILQNMQDKAVIVNSPAAKRYKGRFKFYPESELGDLSDTDVIQIA